MGKSKKVLLRMCNYCQTCWNFPPAGADQCGRINAVGSRSSTGTRILDWRLLRNKRICNIVEHLPQSSERPEISNDDLPSPNFYRRRKNKEKQAKQRSSQNPFKCGMSTNATGFNCVCKFAQERIQGGNRCSCSLSLFLPRPGRLRRLLMEHSKG